MYKGIDIYSEDDVTDWNQVKNDGVRVVYIKATDGVTYVNPKLDSQYNGAKSVGLLVGFYHFAERNNPLDEYNHFKSVISKYNTDLKPCLDYEVFDADFNFVHTFMAQDPELIYYGSHSTADYSGLPKEKIWIAEPNTLPYDLRGYAGIQYSWVGRVAGISNSEVDIDVFGDYVLKGTSPAPNPVPQPQFTGDPVVHTIQVQLNAMTHAGLTEDGIMGPNTEAKIREFQEVVGISVDGIWGPQSASATAQIYAKQLCGLPYHNPLPTRLIQFRMGIQFDGIFGPDTAAHVANWQQANGLAADGIFGPQSWGKLLS